MVTGSKVYRGFVTLGDYGDNYDALGLLPEPPTEKYGALGQQPLAYQLSEDREIFGPYATVRYFVADEERTAEQLTENLVRQLVGDVDAIYDDVYSEITGYLWTDEEIKVGGHDLLYELQTYKGRFVHLEIEWSKEQPDQVLAKK